MIRSAGASPNPASPDYELPHAVTDPKSAVRLAIRLEERVAAAYVELVAATTERREFAATRMRECAIRATAWRGHSVPFPGLPKRATRYASRSPGPSSDA